MFDIDMYKLYADLYDNCRYYVLVLKNKMIEMYYQDYTIEQLRSTFVMIGSESEAQEIDVAIDDSVEITYDTPTPAEETQQSETSQL